MTDRQLLQAIALDLKRAAIGYQSGSLKMADIFLQEGLKKGKAITGVSDSGSLSRVLKKIQQLPEAPSTDLKAEHALTFSTILLSFTTLIQDN